MVARTIGTSDGVAVDAGRAAARRCPTRTSSWGRAKHREEATAEDGGTAPSSGGRPDASDDPMAAANTLLRALRKNCPEAGERLAKGVETIKSMLQSDDKAA